MMKSPQYVVGRLWGDRKLRKRTGGDREGGRESGGRERTVNTFDKLDAIHIGSIYAANVNQPTVGKGRTTVQKWPFLHRSGAMQLTYFLDG